MPQRRSREYCRGHLRADLDIRDAWPFVEMLFVVDVRDGVFSGCELVEALTIGKAMLHIVPAHSHSVLTELLRPGCRRGANDVEPASTT